MISANCGQLTNYWTLLVIFHVKAAVDISAVVDVFAASDMFLYQHKGQLTPNFISLPTYYSTVYNAN